MSWAEIKKAVNSDISKPLNEQIVNKIDDVFSGNYADRYVESDNVLATVPNGTQASSTFTKILEFTAEADGFITVSASIYNSSSYAGPQFGYTRNTVTVPSLASQLEWYMAGTASDWKSDTSQISVTAGDVLRFYFQGNGYSCQYKDVKLTGEIKPKVLVLGAVKHTQRGTFTLNRSSLPLAITLNGFTNPNKMSAHLYGGGFLFSSNNTNPVVYAQTSTPYVASLTKSTLTITADVAYSTESGIRGSYEVIEYY